MKQILGVSLLTAMLVATAMPAQATLPVQETFAVLFHDDMTWEIVPVRADAFQTCVRFAPLENTCTLVDTSTYPAPGGSWTVGFLYPPPVAGPAGTSFAVLSAIVTMSGTNGAAPVIFGCNFEVLGAPFPPQIQCAVLQFIGVPSGTLTAQFHAGFLDARLGSPIGPFLGLLPANGNTIEAGLGSWAGLLIAS